MKEFIAAIIASQFTHLGTLVLALSINILGIDRYDIAIDSAGIMKKTYMAGIFVGAILFYILSRILQKIIHYEYKTRFYFITLFLAILIPFTYRYLFGEAPTFLYSYKIGESNAILSILLVAVISSVYNLKRNKFANRTNTDETCI